MGPVAGLLDRLLPELQTGNPGDAPVQRHARSHEPRTNPVAVGAAVHNAHRLNQDHVMLGIVSTPSCDWHCSAYDTCYTEQDVDREKVLRHKCPLCQNQLGDEPSPRELKLYAQARKKRGHS